MRPERSTSAQQAEQLKALTYARALCAGRLDVEAPTNAAIIKGYVESLDALLAALREQGEMPATLPPCVNGECLYSCADDVCKKADEKGIPWPPREQGETTKDHDSGAGLIHRRNEAMRPDYAVITSTP